MGYHHETCICHTHWFLQAVFFGNLFNWLAFKCKIAHYVMKIRHFICIMGKFELLLNKWQAIHAFNTNTDWQKGQNKFWPIFYANYANYLIKYARYKYVSGGNRFDRESYPRINYNINDWSVNQAVIGRLLPKYANYANYLIKYALYINASFVN